EGPPAQLDGPEAACNGLVQGVAQRAGLVEEDAAVGLDARAVVAAEQPADGLAGDLAEEVPQGDVDAADGVLDGAAAALPEGTLPRLLGPRGGLGGPLADEVGAQQLHPGGHQRLAGHGAADADEPLVGEDLDEGVEVFLGLVALGPAAVDGAAGQAGD